MASLAKASAPRRSPIGRPAKPPRWRAASLRRRAKAARRGGTAPPAISLKFAGGSRIRTHGPASHLLRDGHRIEARVSHKTQRWREADSNTRSLVKKTGVPRNAEAEVLKGDA